MSSRSKSPEKRRPLHARDPPSLEQIRNSIDSASKRLERGNPQTPPAQRFAPSTYSSPGSILGREEDAIVIELDQRYLSAGIEGESHPQCHIVFSPDGDRRIGDYRVWLPERRRLQEKIETWGSGYGLWRNDTQDLDLDLLRDRLERNLRDAYNKYLLVDAGLARVVLVLPSLMPHPVLQTVLSTLFERWKCPNITLLPRPTMGAFSAGLRSALVVDIGWEETAVTSLYEYREIKSHRSQRALKAISRNIAINVKKVVEERDDVRDLRFDLDFIQELLGRALPSLDFENPDEKMDQTGDVAPASNAENIAQLETNEIEVEWYSNSGTKYIKVPCKIIQDAIKDAIGTKNDDRYADDEEKGLPNLIFDALLALSTDVRAVCISRIVFIGAMSDCRSLRHRILNEVRDIIWCRGWSSVRGKHIRHPRSGLSELAQARAQPADARHDLLYGTGKDYVEDRVRRLKIRRAQPASVPSEVREVISLGPWSGGSLLTSLKVRGFVEIERERFSPTGCPEQVVILRSVLWRNLNA